MPAVQTRLDLSRAEILAFRRRSQGLDARLPAGPDSLRLAAWAGLQDSMPRAALLSIHARVAGTQPSAWEDPSLVQVWGPRFSTYVVAAHDVAPFTLGRLPDEGPGRRKAQDVAARLDTFLNGRRMGDGQAGHALGFNPSYLRYAAPTGTVRIRWEGARQPTIWTVPPPDVDPFEARLDLARRYLHVFGPSAAVAFAEWAGIKPPRGVAAFDALSASLVPVTTPIGDAWILAEDEPGFRLPAAAAAPARLLPSGDTWFLLQGDDRELLVPDARLRPRLWTSRVWPGAVLVDGEIAGTWRRAGPEVDIDLWRELNPSERAAIEGEAINLPLPDLRTPIRVQFGG